MAEASSDSEDSKLSLSLSCESSSFEEDLESCAVTPTVAPYQFEPYLDSDEENAAQQTEGDEDVGSPDINSRLNNTDWCSCENCMQMPLAKECVCCKETKVSDLMENEGVQCITDHPGFEPVCLNTYVLDTAYNQYKQQYNNEIQNLPERYRYTAYRQLVRWAWGFLGKHVRVVLPSCAIKRIRGRFPSPQEEYVGFMEAEIE